MGDDMKRDNIEIMSVKSELNKIYKKRYGLFWRFKRNKIELDKIQDSLNEINSKLDKIARVININNYNE